LNTRLRGHYNYDVVIGDYESLWVLLAGQAVSEEVAGEAKSKELHGLGEVHQLAVHLEQV